MNKIVNNADLLKNDDNIIYLDYSKRSYINIKFIPDDLKRYAVDNFDTLFNIHSNKQDNILIYQQKTDSYDEHPAHRWFQSYMHTPQLNELNYKHRTNYMFSDKENLTNSNKNLPLEFEPFLDFINKNRKTKYNQVVINWLLHGSQFIPNHYDCEIGMTDDYDITSISINKDGLLGEPRIFEIVSIKSKIKDYVYDKLQIKTEHGMIIQMCGDTQKYFRHGIPKSQKNILNKKTFIDPSPRISITFRSFIE